MRERLSSMNRGRISGTIYNEDMALSRVAPLSTWKIYDALLGLESGIISPEASEMEWDGTSYWDRYMGTGSESEHCNQKFGKLVFSCNRPCGGNGAGERFL